MTTLGAAVAWRKRDRKKAENMKDPGFNTQPFELKNFSSKGVFN